MSLEITLKQLGNGALEEKFQQAMQSVIFNTCDPNTDATTKRKIVVELTFTPDKNDRGKCTLDTKVTTKLGAAKPLLSMVTMGVDTDTGEVAAYEHVNVQPSLFGDKIQPKERKIVGLHS